jgi:amino acid transporter
VAPAVAGPRLGGVTHTTSPPTGIPADRPPTTVERAIGPWAFVGVALTAFGGPLALAALYAPNLIGDSAGSAGLELVAAAVIFLVPLGIWMRYARQINSSGGLFSFVETAVGRPVALVQASLWIISYLLYVLYTTAQVVFDTLPAVLPGVRPYQPALEILIPVALAGIMLAGRRATLIVTAVIGFGQLALAAGLGGETIAHLGSPLSSFGIGAPTGTFAQAAAGTTLLYICGSLPLFLGGETPVRTVRRGIVAAYLATVVVVVAAVFPLANDHILARADVPGVAAMQQFAGTGFARVIGMGVVVSICGVMLVEYLALTRLIPVVTPLRRRTVTIAVGGIIVAIAPFSLINPDAFYDTLLKVSLVALWLSQLLVFAVYPRFIAKSGGRAAPASILAIIACALTVYGVWTVLHGAASS